VRILWKVTLGEDSNAPGELRVQFMLRIQLLVQTLYVLYPTKIVL